MKVELTQKQIEFIKDLCNGVYDDYDNYSVEDQKKREWMASDIVEIINNTKEN